MKIFTWHIHGSYLYYLSQGNYTLYIPLNDQRSEGYYGRGHTFPFGSNVVEIPVEAIREQSFDCILFQTNKNYQEDQYDILSDRQRGLPRIYLEHNTPPRLPDENGHVVKDPSVTVVHVTHYNRLMWRNASPVCVIDHGITAQPSLYDGRLNKGIVVVNHLHQRGWKLGSDIFDTLKKSVPLDLVGMGTAEYGGLGEVLHPELPAFISRYRFFFNPIRYTSLGLAVLEAMMIGMPIVALASTEYVTVIKDGISGYIHTDPDYLADRMTYLLENREVAAGMGAKARETAEQRFNIRRFTKDWEKLFYSTINA